MTGAKMKRLAGIICVVLGFAANASAASIVGTLNIAGSVTVTANQILFEDQDGVSGLFIVGDNNTGYFAAMPTGLDAEYGSALDLTAPQQSQVGFLQDFNEQPEVPSEYDDLTFDLEDIIEPAAAPCDPNVVYTNGAQCSLGVFLLRQTTGGNLVISMDITGSFVDPSLGADTPATGVYTTQVVGQGINDILEIFGPNGAGQFSADYSAQFTAVPEPATLLTFGAGTALLAAHRRRRAKKNNA